MTATERRVEMSRGSADGVGSGPYELSRSRLCRVGRRAVDAELAAGLGRHGGGVHARLAKEGVLTLPDLQLEAGRVAVAHGYATGVVSGPDREHRRNVNRLRVR